MQLTRAYLQRTWCIQFSDLPNHSNLHNFKCVLNLTIYSFKQTFKDLKSGIENPDFKSNFLEEDWISHPLAIFGTNNQTFQDLKSGIENPDFKSNFLEKDWISNPFSKVDLDLDLNPNFDENCQIQSNFLAL